MRPSLRADILIAAAAASAAALFSAALTAVSIPYPVLLTAAGGALLLFLFTEIETAAPVPRREILVSGEISIVAFSVLFAVIITGKFSLQTAVLAYAAYLICDMLFVRKRCSDPRDMLFTGFLVHSVAAVIIIFLIIRGIIPPYAVSDLLSGRIIDPAKHTFLRISIIIISAGITAFLISRIKVYLSPVTAGQFPIRYWSVYGIIIIARDLSLFAAFCFSGICMLPLDIRRTGSPAASRIIRLALYLIIAQSAAAAAASGYGIIAVIITAAASFIVHGIISRRRKTHAFSQRSFIHSRRDTHT